jgi:hypothetical protein
MAKSAKREQLEPASVEASDHDERYAGSELFPVVIVDIVLDGNRKSINIVIEDAVAGASTTALHEFLKDDFVLLG